MTSLAYVCAMGPTRHETTDEMFSKFIAHVKDASAYINLVNFNGWSSLAYAVSYGQVDMIAKLIELGANVTDIPLLFQSWRAFIAVKGKREKLQEMLPLLDPSDSSRIAVATTVVSVDPSSSAPSAVLPTVIGPLQSQASSSSPSTPTQTSVTASARVSPNAPATAPLTTASPQAQSTAHPTTRGGKSGKGGKGGKGGGRGGRGTKRVQSDPTSDQAEKSQKLGKLIILMQSLTT